jgi:23S rRNA pseudouridine1911/1915/1917 synthase
MINVIFEDNHLLVVEKPYNIPMNLDESKDDDLLSMCKEYIKEKYNKPNNVYLGLVHRLDRPVGGVCVFAKSSKAAARLSDQVRTRTIKKQYMAIVEDNNNNLEDSGTFTDFLIKDKKRNMVTVNPEGKKAVLDYKVVARKGKYAKVLINLQTGRPHQIRVQFATRNHALYGDQRYNKKAIVGQQIALYAVSLDFIHPTLKEEMHFKVEPKKFIF